MEEEKIPVTQREFNSLVTPYSGRLKEVLAPKGVDALFRVSECRFPFRHRIIHRYPRSVGPEILFRLFWDD